MILPVFAYGHRTLKKVCEEIDSGFPELEALISNMWETMYHANGVGLAAPQVGKDIRLFMVDTTLIKNEDDEWEGIKKVFINAEVIEEFGDQWAYEEGCLSIPGVNAEVERFSKIRMKFLDEDFREHTVEYDGMNARVIQHEYDHVEGILFPEKVKPLKRKMLKRKLDKIKKGIVDADYRMIFPRKK